MSSRYATVKAPHLISGPTCQLNLYFITATTELTSLSFFFSPSLFSRVRLDVSRHHGSTIEAHLKPYYHSTLSH